LARCRARPGRQSRRDRFCLRDLHRVEYRRKQLFELVRRVAHHRGLPVDQLLFVHVDRELQRRHRGPLPVAGLQHVDDAILDGEFKVLYILEVLFERLANPFELLIRLRQMVLQFRDGFGGPDACDHILTLRIDQEFAVELLCTVRGVAREGDA
jgi:hypothetical protein